MGAENARVRNPTGIFFNTTEIHMEARVTLKVDKGKGIWEMLPAAT